MISRSQAEFSVFDFCFNSQDVMLNTGALFFTVAEKYGGEVVDDAFTQTCFTTLAQHLGVGAYMRYYQEAEKSDKKGMSHEGGHFSMDQPQIRIFG